MAETIPVTETRTKFISLRMEDGICIGKWVDGLHIDLNIAKEAVKARIEFQNGIAMPVLVDGRGIKSVTREAREYLAKEGAQLVKAGALLIGSVLTRTIGNIFIYVNKPPVPTKLFTDIEEAKKWLKQYI